MAFVPDRQASAPPPSNLGVFSDALYKGAAGLPDLLLNAPNEVMNLARAVFGTVAGASGRPDLMPDVTPNPDIVRGALEKVGLIKGVRPQGFAQHAIDSLTQGAVGGALTGGASLPKAIAGAGMGALSTGASEAVGDLTKSPTAAIASGLLAPAAAGKVAGGRQQVSSHVKTLTDEGVALTPGQIVGQNGPIGGMVQRAEDALQSVPFTGDFIRQAKRRGHETFNIAATNRALEPVGESVPKDIAPGRPAVTYAQDRLGQLYDDLLAKSKGSLDGASPVPNALPAPAGSPPPPPAFRQEIENIRQMVQGGNIHPDQKRQLSTILDEEILARFTPNGGLASGETLKDIESQLGNLHSTFARSDNYDVRRMAGAVKEAQAALRRMVDRENLGTAGELQNINEGYANFKRVQDASGKPYSKEGIFTPSTLQSSVRGGDRSKDKSKFTRGEAVLQDLSEAGKSVMSPTVPDSGTPLRHLFTALTHGDVGGVTGAALSSPIALLYSKTGQGIAQKVLASPERPTVREAAKAAVVPLAEKATEPEPKPAAAKGKFVPDAAVAEAKPRALPEAPRNPKERVLGAVYRTPKGEMEWSENGWLTPKK